MKLMKRNNGFFPTLWSGFPDDELFRTSELINWSSTAPAVNIMETDEGFKLEMAVPGMKKEDFNIDLDKDVLTISAEEKFENEEKDTDGRYTRREFSYSAFTRSFTLPKTIDGEKITATYTDGVLGIAIPKKEEAKPKPPVAIKIK